MDEDFGTHSSNSYGALGLGEGIEANVPTHVQPGTQWARTSAGALYTCGIPVDHTLWCWGSDYFGQLGLGDTGRHLVAFRPRCDRD